MRRTKALLLFTLLLWMVSCVEEAPRFTVPYARVFFRVDLNGLDYDLTPFSYKIYLQGRRAGEATGYGGLLLFRRAEDLLFAYDLCCPHEDDRTVKVSPTSDGKAVCPKCGSVFVTIHGLGSVESGPSTEPLQLYQVRKESNLDAFFLITN